MATPVQLQSIDYKSPIHTNPLLIFPNFIISFKYQETYFWLKVSKTGIPAKLEKSQYENKNLVFFIQYMFDIITILCEKNATYFEQSTTNYIR